MPKHPKCDLELDANVNILKTICHTVWQHLPTDILKLLRGRLQQHSGKPKKTYFE